MKKKGMLLLAGIAGTAVMLFLMCPKEGVYKQHGINDPFVSETIDLGVVWTEEP